MWGGRGHNRQCIPFRVKMSAFPAFSIVEFMRSSTFRRFYFIFFPWMVSAPELLKDKFYIESACNAGFNIKALNHWGKNSRLGKWIEIALRRCCSGALSKALNFCCLSGSAQWPTPKHCVPTPNSLLCDLDGRAAAEASSTAVRKTEAFFFLGGFFFSLRVVILIFAKKQPKEEKKKIQR